MSDKKRTTDLSSMLGTARRAAAVPRPQLEEPGREVGAPVLPPIKRVNLTVHPDLHRRLKILAANRGQKVQELVDAAIEGYLSEQGY